MSHNTHLNIAVTFEMLGSTKRMMGNPSQAIEHLEEALSIKEGIYGENEHTDIADVCVNLGNAYMTYGNREKAIMHLEKAHRLYFHLWGNDAVHPDIAQLLINLAAAYGLESPLFFDYTNTALTMLKRIHGENSNHPLIATALMNIGSCYVLQGNTFHALQYFEKSLTMRKKIYGAENHGEVADSLYALGNLYRENRLIFKAIEYLERALLMYRSIPDMLENSPQIAKVLLGLGLAYQDSNASKAIECYEQSLNIMMTFPETLFSLEKSQLIHLLSELKTSIEKFEIIFQKFLELTGHMYSMENPVDVGKAQYNFARVLAEKKHYRGAEIFYRKALNTQVKYYGIGHIETVEAQQDLASVFSEVGRYAEAEKLYQEILPIKIRHYSPLHTEVAIAKQNFAVLEARFKDENHKAAIFLLESCEAVFEVFSQNHLVSCRNNKRTIKLGSALKSFIEKSEKIPLGRRILYESLTLAEINQELQIAAGQGDFIMLQILIDAGAEVNFFDPNIRKTALDVAITQNYSDCASLLSAHGGELFDENKMTPEAGDTIRKPVTIKVVLELQKALQEAISSSSIDNQKHINEKSSQPLLFSLKNNIYTLFRQGYRFSVEKRSEDKLRITATSVNVSSLFDTVKEELKQSISTYPEESESKPKIIYDDRGDSCLIKGGSVFISQTNQELKTIAEEYKQDTNEVGCRIS